MTSAPFSPLGLYLTWSSLWKTSRTNGCTKRTALTLSTPDYSPGPSNSLHPLPFVLVSHPNLDASQTGQPSSETSTTTSNQAATSRPKKAPSGPGATTALSQLTPRSSSTCKPWTAQVALLAANSTSTISCVTGLSRPASKTSRCLPIYCRTRRGRATRTSRRWGGTRLCRCSRRLSLMG